ncbi:phage portal protein [Paeniglutamicibacter gangotriensis]|uniref:phage portal protein n=1 Tax=Paeniglutamicibacter gangotriensis TaxID=254787 RepID=UPI0037CB9ABA
MGFWDFLKGSDVSHAVFEPKVTYLGGPEWADYVSAAALGESVSAMSSAQMWRTQPNLRTVVSFRARNVAQLGLHVFERVDDSDRRRDRVSPLAVALRSPDLNMTAYDLVFSLVGDLDLFDRAYWMVGWKDGAPSLRRLPPSWVEAVHSDPWTIKHYMVSTDGGRTKVAPENILAFSGYSPSSVDGCSPTIEALKETLKEQIEATAYRAQVWKRGGRVSAVLERPKDAPNWSDGAREAFRDDWYSKYTGRGSMAGGTPILEDGMKLNRIDFNAQEQQYVESAKLALSTIAGAFHVNPTMVGLLDNANYSNVREFRRMLYGDTLGPLLAQIEDRINTFLLPMLGMDPATHYAEFNLGEKLQGSFEEQAAVMQTMVGGPLMTRNEGRGKFNLPRIEGGDELIVPLNVTEGGQASPSDAGSQNVGKMGLLSHHLKSVKSPLEYEIKAPSDDEIPEEHADVMAGVFRAAFKRQRAVVLSRLGSKDSEDYWDDERFDEELSDDILDASLLVSKAVGAVVAEELDGVYDVARTKAFLKKVADRIAGQVNAATLEAIIAGLEDTGIDAVKNTFDVAESSRADTSGMTAAATFVGFAMVEAARQSKPKAMKRWNVNSGNPRASHASMNGETVPIDESYSNGLEWPGGLGADVGEIAGCQCSVTIITA